MRQCQRSWIAYGAWLSSVLGILQAMYIATKVIVLNKHFSTTSSPLIPPGRGFIDLDKLKRELSISIYSILGICLWIIQSFTVHKMNIIWIYFISLKKSGICRHNHASEVDLVCHVRRCIAYQFRRFYPCGCTPTGESGPCIHIFYFLRPEKARFPFTSTKPRKLPLKLCHLFPVGGSIWIYRAFK